METGKLDGQQIDQYRIVRHIARGGMADVYLAYEEELERKVALKIMLPALAEDEEFIERFRREARTVARLDHPHIVQIYSIGLTPTQSAVARRPYIAMQYIEGGSLEEKLKQIAIQGKLLTTEQVLMVTRQIAEALIVAHNANVVHRDLKPSNVLIRPDGKPILVDLGIAIVEGISKLTQTGGIIGTPHYMSPEQVHGKKLDGRSDLYSLGIMMYEMFAGIRPFEGDSSVTILHKQAYEEPIPLSQLRPDLSPKTLSIVDSCLQKEPIRRFQQAETLVLAIDQALKTEGVGGPNPQATQVLTHLPDSALISRQRMVQLPIGERPSARRPVPTWAIATLVALAIAIVLFFVLRSSARVADLPVETAVSTMIPEVIVVQPTETVAPTDTAVVETAVFTSQPTNTPIPTSPPPTPTETVTLSQIIEFTVSGTQAHNETGLQINAGQNVLIEYVSGSWRAGPLPTWPLVGPDGDPQVASKATFPVPAAPIVSLVAGWGSQPPMLVGERLQFQSETAGQLWLGANDDGFSDNGGSLIVRITIEPVSELMSEPVPQYQPVSLGENANAQIDLTSPPVGNVTLGGIPFELSLNIFKSQAATPPFDTAPDRIQLPVDISQAQRIHLLLNSGNGFNEFSNKVIGQVTVGCNDLLEPIVDLQLGVHVREWHNANNAVSTASLTRQVWSEVISDNVSGYIDLLTLDLPPPCRDGRLTHIEIVDTSAEMVGSFDPALNLAGVTVEYFP